MKIKWLLTIVVFVLIFGIVSPAGADEIIFQERLPNILDPNGYGYTPGHSQNEGTADTSISENGSGRALNFGTAEYNRVGDTDPGTIRTILRWDISGLKTLAGTGEHIALHSALVRLGTRGGSGYPDAPSGVVIYPISLGNSEWIEGGGGIAQIGEPCWNFKAVTKVSTTGDPEEGQEGVPWSGSIGLSSGGIDYDDSMLLETVHNLDSAGYQYFHFSLPLDLVEQWLYGSNAGLLLKMADDTEYTYVKFGAAENTHASGIRPFRPTLTLTYTIEAGDPPDYGEAGSVIFQNGSVNAYSDANGYDGQENLQLSSYGSSRAYNFQSTGTYNRVGDTDTVNDIVSMWKWDLSDLAGVTINGATLVMQHREVSDSPGYDTAGITVNLHELATANGGWTLNPSGADGLAEIGASSWNFLTSTNGLGDGSDDGVPWASATGRKQGPFIAGTDYDVTPIASMVFPVLAGGDRVTFNMDVTSSVAGWVADPSSNAGFLTKLANGAADASYVRFFNGNTTLASGEQARRPKLIVTYSTGGTAQTKECGDDGYLPADISGPTPGTRDCYVDMYDYAAFAKDWNDTTM